MFSSSQDKLISYFKNAVEGDSLRQAYIIKGEAGLGKKEALKQISRYIMCHNGAACGKCNGCLSLDAGANPDCVRVTNGDKKIIELEKIRNMIKEVYIKPLNGKYKLFIIENAHLMDAAPQNALLKVIEEPPPYAIFVLVCDNLNSILQTILSRTQVLELEKCSTEDLKAICPLPQENSYMYTYCMGNIGVLKSISSDESFRLLREGVISTFVNMIKNGDYSVYEVIDFWLENKDSKDILLNILTMFLRDVVLIKTDSASLVANTDKMAQLTEVCQKTSLKEAFAMLSNINDAPRLMGKYGNFSMVVQTLFANLKSDRA